MATATVALLLILASAGAPSALLPGDRQEVQAQSPESEFSRLAAGLADQRQAGAEESEKLQERALAILDSMVLAALNAPGGPDLAALNQRLSALRAQPPMVGEDYRVVGLGGSPAGYALAANFGIGGPSAVRLYGGAAGRYALAARIDRFAQKDFFDEYLELVPVAAPVTLFVTVSGRTDELQTGAFVAWQFDGERVRAVWSSDILQQSSYEAAADGFRVTYCAQTDEDKPRVCRRMTRDRFTWSRGSWTRVQQTSVPVPKR